MTLLDAVQIARRFWMTIAACVLLAVGAAAYYAAQQPRLYVAGSEAYVTVGGSTQVAEASVGSSVAGAKATAYAPLTKSGLVADKVIKSLGLEESSAAVSGRSPPPAPSLLLLPPPPRSPPPRSGCACPSRVISRW